MASQAFSPSSFNARMTRRSLMRRVGVGGILAAAQFLPLPGAQLAVANVATEPPEPAPPAPGKSALVDALRIDILDRRRVPPDVSVPLGATVAWVNRGDAWVRIAAIDGSFDSGKITPGRVFAHRFARPGCFTYILENHPIRNMSGRIEVT